ncbi:uncharacterized protein [Henckelia pumila]|uniref:uncharacterized protein n=1 Tax=Henckelia pumila TaxID=405737 RepID=UPI003C6DEDF4
MGLKGGNVLILDKHGGSQVVKDGITVANTIVFDNKLQPVRRSPITSHHRQDAVVFPIGDSSLSAETLANRLDGTCAIVLIKCLHEYASHCRLARMPPKLLQTCMRIAVNDVVRILNDITTHCDAKKIAKVATIYAGGDEDIGHLIVETIDKDANTHGLQVEKIMKLAVHVRNDQPKSHIGNLRERSWINIWNDISIGMRPFGCVLKNQNHEEMENPLILIHLNKISSEQGILEGN